MLGDSLSTPTREPDHPMVPTVRRAHARGPVAGCVPKTQNVRCDRPPWQGAVLITARCIDEPLEGGDRPPLEETLGPPACSEKGASTVSRGDPPSQKRSPRTIVVSR